MPSIYDNFVNDITLEYFTNKEFSSVTKRHLHTKSPSVKPKDKKFYRKRIMSLTKHLLYDTVPESPDADLTTMPPDIHGLFQSYMNKCVEYFKVLDRADILQEEYGDIHSDQNSADNQSTQKNCVHGGQTRGEADEAFLRSVQLTQPNTLDSFVHRTVVKKDPSEYPRKKNINLQDPVLKNKGVSKKKNIDTKYEEAKETPRRNKAKRGKKDTKTKEYESTEDPKTEV